MDYSQFIDEQVAELKREVGDSVAISGLSGGVDSSVVTVLAHKALGEQLKAVFVDNALMREGEPQRIVKIFADMGIPVELLDARAQFLAALKGLADPGTACSSRSRRCERTACVRWRSFWVCRTSLPGAFRFRVLPLRLGS